VTPTPEAPPAAATPAAPEATPEVVARESTPSEPAAAPPSATMPRRDTTLLVQAPATFLGAPADAESERERLLRRKLTQLRDILEMSRGFDAAFGTARLVDVLVLSVVSIARTDTVPANATANSCQSPPRSRPRCPAEMALPLFDVGRRQAELVLALDEEAPIAEEELVWARQHGFAYALSLRSGSRPLGLLLLGTSRAGEPDLELLSYLAEEAALAYERALLYETLHDHTLGVVRGLVTLIERTSNQDASSTERVVRYTQALAHEVQFPEVSRRDLVYGAVLRDIGMLRIDPAILRSRAN
jgi:HD-GYP domain-containing protein (c-di-GMP phosphodiesterase class II)